MRLLLCSVCCLLLIGCLNLREMGIDSDAENTCDTTVPDTSVTTDVSTKDEVVIENTDEQIRIKNLYYEILFDTRRGYFDILSSNGNKVQRSTAEVVDESGYIYSTADSIYTRSLESVKRINDEFEIRILNKSRDTSPDIRIVFSLGYKSGYIKILEEVINNGGDLLRIKKLKPLILRSKKVGALFLGDNPSEHRILENGSNGFLDFYVRLLPGDVKNDGISSVFPFEMEGNSVSNWNHCVMDLTSKRTEMSGFITFDRSVPMVNLSFESDYAKKDADGRVGFSFFSLECPYIPVSLKIKKGESTKSEMVYIDLNSTGCQDALEQYASVLKNYHNIILWNERIDPKTGRNYEVPNGWNSWSGGGGSGGYGTDINEKIILDNLDAMKREFYDFGMKWFQIDDGWEVDNGDWYLNKDRFPDHNVDTEILDSFQFINKRIGEYDMYPGLWIAGLTAYKSSNLYREHTDWFAPKLPYASNEYQIFDFSKSETLSFVFDTFRRIRDWGFKWVKLDFSYWVIAASSLSDPNVTPVEGYKRGIRKVREAIGNDVHFLNVSATGPSIGIVDSVRITLDNMPVWDGKTANLYDMSNQGIKPTYLTAARRYYYNQRVWINHPDLLFFRGMPEAEYKPLTLDESRAFASFVGISGGIVKIGEKIVEMKPEWIDVIRRILPVYPIYSRPLDLFFREFPEIWRGSIKGSALPDYTILALFNWGKNRDLTKNPYEEMEDNIRRFDIDFKNDLGIDSSKEYLVYEFWDEKFYGIYRNNLKVDLPPHRAMVFSIREKTDYPSLVGSNRHILMGAIEVREYKFYDTDNRLHIRLSLPQSEKSGNQFEHRVYSYIPENYTFSSLRLSDDTIWHNYTLSKDLLTISLKPQKTAEAEIDIIFTKR